MSQTDWKAWYAEMEAKRIEKESANYETNEHMIRLVMAELQHAHKLLSQYSGAGGGRQVANITQTLKQIRRHSIELEKGIRN